MSLFRRARTGRHEPNYTLIGVSMAIVAILITGLSFSKRIPFTPSYDIEGVFQSSNQVIKNSPVRIAGVDVGKVTGIEKGPGRTTIVKLRIGDDGRPIRTDATLAIRPRIFLEGGFYVEVKPGSPSAPELDDGGTIGLSQTRTPVQFHQILTRLDVPTRDRIRDLFGELSTGLEKGGAESLGRATSSLGPTLRDVALVAEAARGVRRHDLSDTIRSGSRVTRALASRQNQLADLVTGLNRTTTALASQDTALAASVRELDGVLRVAPAALTALDRALPPTERFLAAARPGLQIAPPVLADTADLMVQLGALSGPSELPRLLDVTGPLLRDLPTFLERLEELLRRVKPVTDCISERVLPVLKSSVNDGPLSNGRPIWLEFLSAVVGLSSASQSFDGNGAAVRYLAGAGNTVFSTSNVSGLGQLVGRAARPVLGSRPTWLGRLGPEAYRPDAVCTDQPAPNLQARTGLGAAVNSRPAPLKRKPLTLKQLERLVERTKVER